jgi:hypothetical protein
MRKVDRIWDALTDQELNAYKDWHDVRIRDKGLQAIVIDSISSLDARKIPIKH